MKQELTTFEKELKDIIETYINNYGNYCSLPDFEIPIIKEYAKDLLSIIKKES